MHEISHNDREIKSNGELSLAVKDIAGNGSAGDRVGFSQLVHLAFKYIS